ncbi:MAG: hypothetical protein HY784_12200 [Chloroflexi bacterium]|nr:hypothetical protein [Chloroflexota bacterium]
MNSRTALFAALLGLMGLLGLALLALAAYSLLSLPPAAPATPAISTPIPGAVLIVTRTPVPTLPPAPTATPPPALTPGEVSPPATDLPPTATPPPARPTSPPPTRTPAPTATPPPTATPASAHGLTGQLTLCPKPVSGDGLPHYTAVTERVCFVELITNTSTDTVKYSILGVQATNLSGGQGVFQTSWRGDLSICPGCKGPNNGPWEDGLFLPAPGTYSLSLSICYSSVDICQGASGEWETLAGGIRVVADPAP